MVLAVFLSDSFLIMALAIIFKTLLCLQVYLCLGENTTNFGCCNVTKTELKRFLGLLQFYRHMLPHLAHSVHRLYALTSTKVDFQWDAAADKACNAAKSMLEKDIMSNSLKGNKGTVLYTDASSSFHCKED